MRQPDVVWVHVRHHDAQHRQAFQLARENGFPLRFRFVPGDTAVNDGPAGLTVDLVTQQPQVDVVQRKGQTHANPADAGRDL